MDEVLTSRISSGRAIAYNDIRCNKHLFNPSWYVFANFRSDFLSSGGDLLGHSPIMYYVPQVPIPIAWEACPQIRYSGRL